MKYLIALSMVLHLATGAAQAADKKLTISVYAFAQDAFKKALYDPFEKICGCELVIETGNSVERMAKIEANAAKPVVDMAVMSSHDALALALPAKGCCNRWMCQKYRATQTSINLLKIQLATIWRLVMASMRHP